MNHFHGSNKLFLIAKSKAYTRDVKYAHNTNETFIKRYRFYVSCEATPNTNDFDSTAGFDTCIFKIPIHFDPSNDRKVENCGKPNTCRA